MLQARAAAVAAGHTVIEIDAVLADAELAQGVALGGEILLVGRAAGVADQHAGVRRRRADRLATGLGGASSARGLASGRRRGELGRVSVQPL